MDLWKKIFGSLFRESEEERHFRKLISEIEKYEENKKKISSLGSTDLFRRLNESKLFCSKIEDVAQELRGWDRTFFIMNFGGPDARSVFRDVIAKLEEEAADGSDPKVHLGVGMALTCYASRMLAKDEALIYLQKIVSCYQKALKKDPKNGYYQSCLEYANWGIVACGKEAVGKVSENGHSLKIGKASDLDIYLEYLINREGVVSQVVAAAKEGEMNKLHQIKEMHRRYLEALELRSKGTKADFKVGGAVLAVSIAIGCSSRVLF